MRVSFQIRTKKENIITDKGIRAFVMDRLLNSPFSRATVINIDEKTVEVRIEGDEKQIREFKKELEKSLLSQFGNPTITLTDFIENPFLEIPEIIRSSQALLVGQLSNGIGVQLQILSTLNGMSAEINSGFKNLSNEIRTELKNLPIELAKAIKEK